MTFPLRLNVKYFEWLICLTYLSLLLPIKWSNIILILPGAYAFMCLDFNKVKVLWKRNLFIKFIIAYFLILIVGLLYTTDSKSGLFILEKKISLIVLPILFMPHFSSFSEKSLKSLLQKIGICTIAGSILMLLFAVFKFVVQKESQAFYYEEFTPIHYVYYAIYFSFGSLIFLDFSFDHFRSRNFGYVIWAVFFAYSLGILILVSSKMGIIAFVLGAVLLLYRKIQDKKVFFISIMVLTGSLILFILIHDTTKQRFVELGKNIEILNKEKFTYDPNEQFTGLNLRLLFWKFSLTHLMEEKAYVSGVGTGDAQHFLDESYALHNLTAYDYIGWGPHNQWIFTLIQVGLIGMLPLVLLYLYGIRSGIRNRNFVLIYFLLVTFCFSLTESILESNKGIVFFAIFFSILLSTALPQSEETL